MVLFGDSAPSRHQGGEWPDRIEVGHYGAQVRRYSIADVRHLLDSGIGKCREARLKHLLPAPKVAAVVHGLDAAFHGMRQHDLWDAAGRLICSDVEKARISKLKGSDLDQLGPRDLDYLMSCAGLTIGTGETVRFLTPRFLKAFLSFPAFGWYTTGKMLRARLDWYNFDGWQRHQRMATANALDLMGRATALMADEFDNHSEADGMELIAWAEAKRTAVEEEADKLRHKATMRKRVRGKVRKRHT